MRSLSARLAWKAAAAYLVASTPGIWVMSTVGPHGPILSMPQAFAYGLWFPWDAFVRASKGELDGLTLSLVLFWPWFLIGLVLVWLTERKGKRSASPSGTAV